MAKDRLLTLLIAAFLAAPEIASAQGIIAPATQPAPPPPVQLFNEKVPESSGRLIESIRSSSSSWWEPPASGSEVPRFQIGQTFSLNTAGGVALSAGFFGRRGDPLPLFLSQNVTRDMQRGRDGLLMCGKHATIEVFETTLRASILRSQ